MNRGDLLTELGRILVGSRNKPRALPENRYFRCDQAKLDAERDAAAPLILAAIERYQRRFSRQARERALARRAAGGTKPQAVACPY